MAKKKEPIEEIKAEDVMVESVEEKKEESFADRFIYEQLKVINKLPDRAKAKRLANRLLMNRKG